MASAIDNPPKRIVENILPDVVSSPSNHFYKLYFVNKRVVQRSFCVVSFDGRLEEPQITGALLSYLVVLNLIPKLFQS